MRDLFLQTERANQAHFSNCGLEMQSTEHSTAGNVSCCGLLCYWPWISWLLREHLVVLSQGLLSPGSTEVCVFQNVQTWAHDLTALLF